MTEKAIICVDDDEMILTSLGEQLKRNFSPAYQIELTNSGEEALLVYKELIAEGVEVALVISDQNMKGMRGDELLIQLHQNYPESLKILLTGESELKQLKNIINAAVLYRYIPKPWQAADLILTVEKALHSYAQDKEIVQQHQLLQATNQQLQHSVSLLQATLEATADGIIVFNQAGKIITYNQKFCDLWQLQQEIPQQQNQLLELLCTKLKNRLNCQLTAKIQNKTDKYRILSLKNGKFLEYYSQIQQFTSFDTGIVWSFRDVTQRQQAEAIIEHQAFHDSLTNLPNRCLFDRYLAQSLIAKQKQDTSMLAIMFLDLDRFKNINDTLGHSIGDLLLKKVVKRLKDCLRTGDIISRWGGDEFTLLLPQINSRQDASLVANRILKALNPPFDLDGNLVKISSSIGIACYPEDGNNAETLLKNADAALYHVKEKGRNNYHHYEQSINSQASELLILENSLHSALEKEQFVLCYQPIINTLNGKVAKVETLLRWRHPELGLVSPNIFIPLAEANGTIIEIGKWTIKTACAQYKTWQKLGIHPAQIAVNLSARQFQDAYLASDLQIILTETGLDPACLELEITESVMMRDINLAQKTLNKFYNLGIGIAMDDFGTGYSSLSYLSQFAFNTIKIDQSFIRDLQKKPQDTSIVQAIISLGKALELNVVAEGVETAQLKELLTELGCQYMQGYLFSKPLFAPEATQLLTVYTEVAVDLPSNSILEVTN